MSKKRFLFPLVFWYFVGILIFITGLIVSLLQLSVSLPANILVFIYIVIFTTLMTMRLRNTLYCHLRSHSTKTELLKKLKKRFERASKSLDIVNTSALLEKFYGKEEFDFFELPLSCEKWDYFCRILPNLLIAFGLLGTFWGITQNLSGISEILNNNTSSTMISVENLQTPLKSMGIAFSSSLVALFCSVLITFANFIWNTNLAKNNLLNSIEDQLDNIYQTKINGDTRLSKAVKEMADLQEKFLTRFHEKVGKVLEDTLRPVAQQIADENKKSNQTVVQLGEQFTQSSGTISRAAEKFQFTISSLSENNKQLKESVSSLADSSNILKVGSLTFQEASIKIQDSKFSENLENLTQNLANTQSEFAQSTKLLSNNVEAMIENNQEFTELARQVYIELRQSSAQWQDGAIVFLESAEILKESQFAENLVKSTQNITDAHQNFAQTLTEMNLSLNVLKDYSQAFKILIKQLLNLGNEVKSLNEQSGQLLFSNKEKIANEIEVFEKLSTQIDALSSNFTESQSKIDQTFNQIGESLSESVNQNNASNMAIIGQVEQEINQLNETINSQINLTVESFKKLLTNQTTNLENLVDKVVSRTYTYNQSIFDILQEIQNIQVDNNSELKVSNASNSVIMDNLKVDSENTIAAIESIQQNIERLISSTQLQSSELVKSLNNQNEVLKKSLQDHAEWQVKENSKGRKDNLAVYQNLERSFLNLGEINSKLTRLVEMLNQQINNPNSQSNVTNLIDKLKGI
jgi:hypothetical protein